jgi:hypothetical protein
VRSRGKSSNPIRFSAHSFQPFAHRRMNESIYHTKNFRHHSLTPPTPLESCRHLQGQAPNGVVVLSSGKLPYGWLPRYWTPNEQRELFQHYFDSRPAVCPICAQTTRFRMHYTFELVLLSACCPGCQNRSILFFGGIIGLPAQTPHRQRQKF